MEPPVVGVEDQDVVVVPKVGGGKSVELHSAIGEGD